MSSTNPFEDLLTEADYSEARGQTVRTSQRERAQRIGPPYIKIGRKTFYRKAAVREWLLSKEKVTVRE